MKLIHYIRGFRKGKEAHRIELEAMKDPFLAESLEGYDLVKGDHASTIEKLQQQVTTHSRSRYRLITGRSVAASLLVCISIGGYFLIQNRSPHQQVACDEMGLSENIEVSVPEADYAAALDSQKALPDKTVLLSKIENKHDSPSALQTVSLSMTPETKIVADEHYVIHNSMQEKEKQIISTADRLPVMVQYYAPDASDNSRRVSFQERGKLADTTNNPASTAFVKQSNKIDPYRLPELSFTIIGLQPDTIVTAQCQNHLLDNVSPKPLHGMRAYKKYLKDNIIYPADSLSKEIKGKVIVEFTVDVSGTPRNIIIKKSLCYAADQEAIRLVKNGPKWMPGNRKVSLTVTF